MTERVILITLMVGLVAVTMMTLPCVVVVVTGAVEATDGAVVDCSSATQSACIVSSCSTTTGSGGSLLAP